MNIYQYYVHFRDGISRESFTQALFSVPDCDIYPIFDGSFLVITSLSYSKFHHALVSCWPEEALFIGLLKKCADRARPETPHQGASL